MIQADTFDEMEALLEKAKTKRDKLAPTVTIIEFGEYRVSSSRAGKEYTVQAGETKFGEIWIGCFCRGGLEGKPCYHASAMFPIHRQLAEASDAPRRSKEPHEIPYLKGTKHNSEKVGNIRI